MDEKRKVQAALTARTLRGNRGPVGRKADAWLGRGRGGRGGLAHLLHEAAHGVARLGTVLHPVVHPGEIDVGVGAFLLWIVVPDDLDELAVARAALVGDDNFIIRGVFGTLAAES